MRVLSTNSFTEKNDFASGWVSKVIASQTLLLLLEVKKVLLCIFFIPLQICLSMKRLRILRYY